jgi:nucleoside-diphosphate-sugar epimerase
MFGNGKNKKSMAYVENVAAFLEYSLKFEPGIHIYNYIDKPDYDMNKLISFSRNILFGKNNVGMRLPAFLGVLIGYFFDFLSKVFKLSLPVSSIRVKKFMGTTLFSSRIKQLDFNAPFQLEEGLRKTLKYEFLENNSDKKTFETE